jgi:hypothetical protein
MSPIVLITAIESGFGFLLTSTILYLVLRNAKKIYHYLFAAFLFICVIWDLGVFLMMLRNEHVNELEVFGRIITQPCFFLPALIFHFVNLYTGRPIKWAVILLWVITGLLLIPTILGISVTIEGHYSYSWGNIFRMVPSVINPLIILFWIAIFLTACWLLYRNIKKLNTPLERRHYSYIIASLIVVGFAIVKTLVTMGIDLGFMLPLGMFLNDSFVTIIGVAIIKERLFDITIIIKKGTLYSILAGLLIFIYSFVEHILVTFIGERVGENSTVLHLTSIAIGIAVLMPVKNRLERGVEKYFAQKKLVF